MSSYSAKAEEFEKGQRDQLWIMHAPDLLLRLSQRKKRNICARAGFFLFRQISTF